MKKDPTRTKMLRISYSRMLIQRFTKFYKHVTPMLLQLYNYDLNSLNTQNYEEIIDQHLDIYVNNNLNYDIGRYTGQGYKRGKKNSIQKMKQNGITISPLLTPLDMETMNLIRDNNAALVKGLGFDVRKNIVRILNEGILQGHGSGKTARNIRKTIPMTRNRSKTIARTEIIRGYNQAQINQYKNAGLKHFQWLTAFDDRTCEDCAGLDGTIHPVDEGVRPPLHPNCRCTTIHYIKK